MKEQERRRLEEILGQTDVLALADITADYYQRLRDRGFSIPKAFELAAELHSYICSSTFPASYVYCEAGEQ